MSEFGWQFWIDVGGTFTDCIALSTEGQLLRHKCLSSGVTKGTVGGSSDRHVIHDDALWVPLEELHRLESPLELTLGGQSIRLFHDADAMTAWAEDTDGELLSGVLAYREGWHDFFPKSRGLE